MIDCETLKRQVSELEDVVVSLQCEYEGCVDDICQTIYDEEKKGIDSSITISHIKEIIDYKGWVVLEDESDD